MIDSDKIPYNFLHFQAKSKSWLINFNFFTIIRKVLINLVSDQNILINFFRLSPGFAL